ncbi:hypothetical protein [Nocardioides dilutus]
MTDEPPAGTGHLRLTVQPTLLGRPGLGVTARVDGEPVRVQHGENVIPLAAGRHRVEASTFLTGGSGDVTIEVDVPAGGQVALWYAPSFVRAVSGRIGDRPQRPAGTWFVVLVALILVVGMAYTFAR